MSRLNLIGIQNWRRASTLAGISRDAFWRKYAELVLIAGGRNGRPAASTQCDRIGSRRRCSILAGVSNRDQSLSRTFMTR